MRKNAGLAPVAVALLREAGPLPEGAGALARRIKRCELRLVAPAPIARAISTASGIAWSEIDADFMLIKRPGIFALSGPRLVTHFSTSSAPGVAS